MGYWKTQRGIGGDPWADLFGKLLNDLSEVRPPGELPAHEMTLGELADLVEFCTLGHLTVEVSEEDAVRPLGWLHGPGGAETIPNRGQIGGLRGRDIHA